MLGLDPVDAGQLFESRLQLAPGRVGRWLLALRGLVVVEAKAARLGDGEGLCLVAGGLRCPDLGDALGMLGLVLGLGAVTVVGLIELLCEIQ